RLDRRCLGHGDRGLTVAGMAVGDDMAARTAPMGPRKLLEDVGGLFRQIGEEAAPALIDRSRIFQPAGIERGDEGGVGAAEESGLVKSRHGAFSTVKFRGWTGWAPLRRS